MEKNWKNLVFDIEVVSYPELVELCKRFGLNEWKLTPWKIEASTRYVSHISFGFENEEKVTDLSILDGVGSLKGDTNEMAMLVKFAKAWNEADQTTAHYGSKFDLNFLNSRMTRYGLPRLKPVKLTDTWRILKNQFALPSNTLDSAITYFKCPYGKPKLSQEVWQKVGEGDIRAIKLLRNRCRFDVKSLRWIYKNKLKPFDTTKSNRALAYQLYDIDDAEIARQLQIARCPSCQKPGSLKREGYSYKQISTNVQLSCRTVKCGAWPSAPLEQFQIKKKSPVRYRLGAIR